MFRSGGGYAETMGRKFHLTSVGMVRNRNRHGKTSSITRPVRYSADFEIAKEGQKKNICLYF